MRIKSGVWYWLAVASGAVGMLYALGFAGSIEALGVISDTDFITAMVLLLLALFFARLGDPLDGGTGFLRHCGIVSGHSRGHALGQQHRIHAGAALQQLCDRVLAVDEALVPGLVVGLFAAGTAGHIAFFHEVLLPFLSQDAKALPARRHRIASNEFSGPQRCKAAFCGRH